MKRALVLILLMITLAGTALANDYIYIANPHPSDRLHLRESPSESAKSLGRYYNGAPIQRLYFAHSEEWVQVKVGLGGHSLTGYMKKAFLSDEEQPSAMPQYVAAKSFKAYAQPSLSAKQVTIAGGRLVSLMGFSDGWWHVMGHTLTSEGNYTCFVPANAPELIPLGKDSDVPAHISNPDPADRLHLRTAPKKTAKSLGKYYNGTIGELKGFSDDGVWLKVNLYGREGYMMSEFITIEGATNHTRYGIPTARTLRQTRLYQTEKLTGQAQSIASDTELEVLGVMEDEQILHVRIGEATGFMRWKDTSFTD